MPSKTIIGLWAIKFCITCVGASIAIGCKRDCQQFWLIGRAYSATIERRRTSEEEPFAENENFYDHRFAPIYQEANLDEVFKPLYDYSDINKNTITPILEVHRVLTQTLHKVTKQWKRSLATKYLHFHFPDLIFIYDKRASNTLGKYVPRWWKRELEEDPRYDMYYYRFCLSMMNLRDAIDADYHIKLSPRQLDNLLLSG